MSAGIGPLRTTTSATSAAVVTIGIALVSLMAALAGLEALGLAFAGALALLLLTPAIGRLHTRGLVVWAPPRGYASVAVTHALKLQVENRSRWFAASGPDRPGRRSANHRSWPATPRPQRAAAGRDGRLRCPR